jgi:hypothetical protein
MSLTSSSVIYGSIAFTFIPIGIIAVLVFKYTKYRKKRIAHIYERYEGLMDREKYIKDDIKNLMSFWEYCTDTYLGVFATAIILMLGIGVMDIILAGTIYDTRQEEPVYYQAMITKKETIEDSLVVTTDIVNTQLYESAIAFNTDLVEYQQYSINPNYKYNFTGNCDWFAIEPIKLK